MQIIAQWVPGSWAGNSKCSTPIRAETVSRHNHVMMPGRKMMPSTGHIGDRNPVIHLWWRQLCTGDTSLNFTSAVTVTWGSFITSDWTSGLHCIHVSDLLHVMMETKISWAGIAFLWPGRTQCECTWVNFVYWQQCTRFLCNCHLTGCSAKFLWQF